MARSETFIYIGNDTPTYQHLRSAARELGSFVLRTPTIDAAATLVEHINISMVMMDSEFDETNKILVRHLCQIHSLVLVETSGKSFNVLMNPTLRACAYC
ncbi:MAG: hypothetical protein AAFV93_13840 [Chloroflexota bacterium]